jgi:hypothetical protein
VELPLHNAVTFLLDIMSPPSLEIAVEFVVDAYVKPIPIPDPNTSVPLHTALTCSAEIASCSIIDTHVPECPVVDPIPIPAPTVRADVHRAVMLPSEIARFSIIDAPVAEVPHTCPVPIPAPDAWPSIPLHTAVRFPPEIVRF